MSPNKPSVPTWVKVICISSVFIGLAAFFSLLYFLNQSIKPHKHLIYKYSQTYQIDPLLSLAVIQVESNFDQNARSRKGAVGLMQLMPDTAVEEARELHVAGQTLDNLERPEFNINLGIHHLAKLSQQFKGNTVLTLAAYNAGSAAVKSWLGSNQNLEISEIPYPETRNFVKRVLFLQRCFKISRKLKRIFTKT